MKKTMLLLGILSLWLWSTTAHAAFVSGSTGALGAFNPTANTVVTLPPDGVLNYTTINIPSGVTVTFTKNVANTPVYMLATGDVVITGAINGNGGNGTSNIGTGGPGGGDGGYGGTMYVQGGKGLGPGGGSPGPFGNGCNWGNTTGGGGGFGTAGSNGCASGGAVYGNARLVPLLGGSGGGGSGGPSDPSRSGGGGGGAILIASSSNITINGSITANGGVGSSDAGGCGSGGGIRIIANTVSGNGSITALGGINYGQGGAGRIRLEAYTNNRTAPTNPQYSYGLPGSVFLANFPALNITSVAGNAAPSSPTGNYNQPDMLLPSSTTNPVAVSISAINIPDGTTVTVSVIPQFGMSTSVNTILSGSAASANVNLSTYSNVITAQATFTVVGIYYEGEEIDRIRVATRMGGKSETTYITKSGKEIKGELLAALMAK